MKKSDWTFLAPIIILALNFIYRLANFATIIWRFPLDYVNDLSSYLSLLHFLQEYGYQHVVTSWYHGFVLFKVYPPGWYFFTYPWLLLTGNVGLAAFISTICLYFLGFIGLWLLGKYFKLSLIQVTAVFLFTFANPMAVGAVLKQGRLPALMALVLMIYLFIFLLYFKEKRITFWKGVLFAATFAALLITHSPEVLIFGILLCGLFLVKDNKERLKIIGTMLLGILLSSWWLFGFLNGTRGYGVLEDSLIKGRWILDFSQGFLFANITLIILPIILLVLYFLYQKQNKSLKDFIFFLPLLVLTLLVLLRLVVFIPLINQIYIDTYQDLFALFCGLFLVAIDWSRYGKKIMLFITIGLIAAAGISVAYNMKVTLFNEPYTDLNNDMLAMLNDVNDTYIILSLKDDSPSSYEKAYYCYGSIFLNKTTSSGWGPWYKGDRDYIREVRTISNQEINNLDCDGIITHLHNLQTPEVISYDESCAYFTDDCGFTTITSQGRACLLAVP